MTRTAPLALAATLLAATFAACSGGAGSGSGGDLPAALDGRTFLSTEVVGYELAPGSRLRLTFDGESLGASGGCNSIGGTYRIEGGKLVADQLMTTEMACEEPLMAQDAWLIGLLAGSLIGLADDTLTLQQEGIRVTFRDREVADPDRPVEGTRWVLDGILTEQAASSVPAGVVAALTFADGNVQVEAGCNGGSGSATIGEGTIAFGPIATTRMMCDEPRMEVEAAVLGVLQGDVAFEVEAATLTLTAGPNALKFRAEE